MSATHCGAKHTKYNPTGDKWRCPKCGCTDGSFYIEEGDEEASESCTALHQKDYIVCMRCEWSGSGNVVAKRLAALDHVETCPTCKGKGVVPAKT